MAEASAWNFLPAGSTLDLGSLYAKDHEEGHHDVIDGVDYAMPDLCPLCKKARGS